jgi:hypothetical protein
MKVCHKCNRELGFESRVLRSERCHWCDADLHCCKNCRFWDPNAHNECREVGTALIRDREAANYCGSFEFLEGNRGDVNAEANAAKKKLDDLFKF